MKPGWSERWRQLFGGRAPSELPPPAVPPDLKPGAAIEAGLSEDDFRSGLSRLLGGEWVEGGGGEWRLVGERDGIAWSVLTSSRCLANVMVSWEHGPVHYQSLVDAAWHEWKQSFLLLRTVLPQELPYLWTIAMSCGPQPVEPPTGFPAAATVATFIENSVELMARHVGSFPVAVSFEGHRYQPGEPLVLQVEAPEAAGGTVTVENVAFGIRKPSGPAGQTFRCEARTDSTWLRPRWPFHDALRVEPKTLRLDERGHAQLSCVADPLPACVRVLDIQLTVVDREERYRKHSVQVEVEPATLFVGFCGPHDPLQWPGGGSPAGSIEILDSESIRVLVCRLDGTMVPDVSVCVRVFRSESEELSPVTVTSAAEATPVPLSVPPGKYSVEGWLADEAGRVNAGFIYLKVTRPFAAFWAGYSS